MVFRKGAITDLKDSLNLLFRPPVTDEGFQRQYIGSLQAPEARARQEASKIWADKDPRLALDWLVGRMPNSIQASKKYEPGSRPSEIELYFFSRIPELRHMLKIDKPEDGMTAIDSAYCLRDSIRTRKFLEGLSEALESLSSRDAIYVCDAGSGAIPIFAIYAALYSPKVSCTCIEINPNSVEASRIVISSFGLQDRIKVIHADARSYKPDKPMDILISETMNQGLFDEPIVQIISNLAPSELTGIIRLPQQIEIKAATIPRHEYLSHRHGYMKPGSVPCPYVTDGWQNVFQYTSGDPLDEISFPISIGGQGKMLLLISHEARVGSQRLALYESLTTLPKPFEMNCRNSMTLRIEYRPGAPSKDILIYKEADETKG